MKSLEPVGADNASTRRVWPPTFGPEKMMISPWHDESVSLSSPDGKWLAVMRRPCEIAMGAPTAGRLEIGGKIKVESCNPSMVWSDDSRYLAVPQWQGRDAHQRLVVLDLAAGVMLSDGVEYRVLQLESFTEGVVRGIDSPIYMPAALAVDVTLLMATR